MCHNRKAKKHWNKKQGKAHYKEVNLKKQNKKTVDRKRKKRETFAFLTTSTEPSDDVAG